MLEPCRGLVASWLFFVVLSLLQWFPSLWIFNYCAIYLSRSFSLSFKPFVLSSLYPRFFRRSFQPLFTSSLVFFLLFSSVQPLSLWRLCLSLSVRMIMPFRGDDPLLTRAYVSLTSPSLELAACCAPKLSVYLPARLYFIRRGRSALYISVTPIPSETP